MMSSLNGFDFNSYSLLENMSEVSILNFRLVSVSNIGAALINFKVSAFLISPKLR